MATQAKILRLQLDCCDPSSVQTHGRYDHALSTVHAHVLDFSVMFTTPHEPALWKESESEVAQSCPTLCNPMYCLLGSSIHGIFQARILEWVDISFSRRSSWPRDWAWVSRIVGTLYHLSHQAGSAVWLVSVERIRQSHVWIMGYYFLSKALNSSAPQFPSIVNFYQTG